MTAASVISSCCPEVLVLRHGQTEWNATGRLQGHLDSPLTEKGLRQARRQHELLQPYDLTGFRFITSPQARARKTAQIALAGLAAHIETSSELMEIGLGAWAGSTRAEIAQERMISLQDLGQTQFYDWAPGGEGTERLYERCAAFLSQLTGPAVLITHGMTRCVCGSARWVGGLIVWQICRAGRGWFIASKPAIMMSCKKLKKTACPAGLPDLYRLQRVVSSVGRALRLHRRCREFEPLTTHQSTPAT